jgi:HEAT repeat protein
MEMKTRNLTSRIPLVVVAALLAAVFVAGTCADAWADRDDRKAESLYKSARKALNAEKYRDAAEQFAEVYDRYPDSKYAAEALYWQAFAHYRLGGKSEYKKAQRALEKQLDEYSDKSTREDATELYYTVLGKLAEMGDAEAAERLAEDSERHLERGEDVDVDIEEKIAVLHALINMRSEKALPMLEKLMADKDPKKAELREQALFLLAQYDSDKAVEILVRTAKEDPDPEVRQNAVFWLSQTRSEMATDYLLELLESEEDPEVQEKAVFALSQVGDDRAFAALQRVAMDKTKSVDIRANAIFWLGQGGHRQQVKFLKELYTELDDDELKEKVIFSVSQNSRGGDWLMEIVADPREPVEIRKQALFWAGQTGSVDVEDIAKIYNTSKDTELREQAIFALSQRQSSEAVKLMIDLARKEKDPELRKKLLFWIGQSGDPAAEDFLIELIND